MPQSRLESLVQAREFQSGLLLRSKSPRGLARDSGESMSSVPEHDCMKSRKMIC